jgi:glycosyltransferase involved in cell wall biosynthesis
MRAAWFAIPGDLAAPTGGYEYARQLLRYIPGLIHLPLPAGFPQPSEIELARSASALAAVPGDDVLLVDGLAYGAMPAGCLAEIRAPVVALVHHPLCLEAGLAPERAASLLASERHALLLARRVIATSSFTARWLVREFGVLPEKLTVVEPGTVRQLHAVGSLAPEPRLLAVGAITPRKGYDILVEALAGLTDRDWRLTIAGDLSRDPDCVSALRAVIAGYALTDRVALAGAVPDSALDALYAESDLFVTASLHEGYGMAVASAMAHGLPLVATNAGALADTIPPGAAIFCPPADAIALRRAIGAMLTDPDLRRACAEISWQAGQNLPDWRQAAGRVAAVIASA